MKEAGAGKVLVVDAGASMQSAVLGDILASVAKKHGGMLCWPWQMPRMAECLLKSAAAAVAAHCCSECGMAALNSSTRLPCAPLQGGRALSSMAACAMLPRYHRERRHASPLLQQMPFECLD